MAERPVVIVGAGIAGLLAAGTLARAGRPVVVLDKGRGVGGRLATRRLAAGAHGTALADHGAQFFTARTPEVAELVTAWSVAGLAEPWFSTRLEPDGSQVDDGDIRYRVRGGMTAIAKHLTAGLDVRTGVTVTALEPHAGAVDDPPAPAADGMSAAPAGWRVRTAEGPVHEAAAVVLTAPVPQALVLLDAGAAPVSPADRAALEAITYDPCLAVMAVLDGPSGIAAPGAWRPSGEPIEWIADNHTKGISPWPTITIHASSAFSLAHWDRSDAEIAAELLAAAGLADRLLRPGADAPRGAHGAADDRIDGPLVRRWRYAKPAVVHPEPLLLLASRPPLVLAGDAFGGPRVEGAARSGLAAGRAIADLLDTRSA